MRYFNITDQDGPSRVRVPVGKELADLGYPPEIVNSAVETSRPPGSHHHWNVATQTWIADGAAIAAEERHCRLKRRLPDLIGDIESRLDALESDAQAARKARS
jgi:hypothetical protein